MKFGKVDDPGKIDFQLPDDHPDTAEVLEKSKANRDPFEVYVGCAKWGRKDLKGFYPRGTKDELTYYATQFNSVELNSTFYAAPSLEQTSTWGSKTPADFRFFPKIPRYISHIKWLKDVQEPLQDFCDSVMGFEEKLGMVFLQLNDKFQPNFLDRLTTFVENFPNEIPLAIEVRHPSWFVEPPNLEALSQLLKEHNRTNIIVDTAGRRDMLHMRLTNHSAFVRYVGANHESDYSRLDTWVERIMEWRSQGLQKLCFFVHQNEEKASPALSAHFIRKLNDATGLSLKIPVIADNPLGL